MATEEAPLRATYPSAGDLSAKQYCWMKIDTAGRVTTATEGQNAYGVLQNKPAAIDRESQIWHGGGVRCILGGTVTAGDSVTCDLNGKTVAVGSGDDYRLGIARESGVVNQIIGVAVDKRGLL